MTYKIIIPARHDASRLPGKPLMEINGKSLLQHVHESAQASRAGAVIVATDDERIRAVAEGFGARVCMTHDRHRSGTERLAETVDQLREPDDSIIVNLQGDEFGMPAVLLDQVAELLASAPAAAIATLCERIDDRADLDNPNVVKVVFDQRGRALYFSRSAIPWGDQSTIPPAYRHIGLYAYRTGFLRRYVAMPVSALEKTERLEQLRALDQGAEIRVAVAAARPGIGIDTMADLEKARRLLTY